MANDAVPNKEPVIEPVTTNEPEILTVFPITEKTSILADATVNNSPVLVMSENIREPVLPDMMRIPDPLPEIRVLPLTSSLLKLPVSV